MNNGEVLICGHASFLPARLLYTENAYCERCQAWIDRVPGDAADVGGSRLSRPSDEQQQFVDLGDRDIL